MKKRAGGIAGITLLLVLIILGITVFSTIKSVKQKMTQYCFEELTRSSMQLADDLKSVMLTDRTTLSVMAGIIAGSERIDETTLLSIMNSMDMGESYLSYIAILRPDAQLLKQDGSQIDVSGRLDFQVESERGTYISEMEEGIFDPEDKIVRSAMPVVKDGEVIAVLYGILSLDALGENYTTDIYDGGAYVALEDGDTGNYLLDMWHQSYGNIEDLRGRKTVGDYNFDQTIADLQAGRSGNLCGISRTTGQTIYIHYEPTGINNWNVVVSVDEERAFKNEKSICNILYIMAAIVSVSILIYMVSLMILLIRIYKTMRKLDTEDQITQLQNRNAYDAYIEKASTMLFREVTCVYIDANGLHEVNNQFGHNVGDQMLQVIAKALKIHFPYECLYRIGGDEFVALCEDITEQECAAKTAAVSEQVKKYGYSISVGIAGRINEQGMESVVREADEKMLENKRQYYLLHERRQERQ